MTIWHKPKATGIRKDFDAVGKPVKKSVNPKLHEAKVSSGKKKG